MSLTEAQKQVAAIQANAHKFKQKSIAIETNTHPKAVSVIDEIFTRLKAISSVGNAFKSAKEEAIVKQEWMLALREEGVSKQSMIDDGIDAFRVKARKNRNTTWFPSIGEFIDLCKGNDNKQELAVRAYNLFIRREQQIDTVGRMVTASHSFELRQLKASESEKQFIKLYLHYAENNAIEPLESHLISETVQLSPEQQEEAERRANEAKNQFLEQFSGLIADKPKNEDKKVKPGIKAGKIQAETKQSLAQAEKERVRQLKEAGLLKNEIDDH
jgi:hypothetical protein